MTILQQLLDFLEQLKCLDTGTLEGWLEEHALFTLVLVIAMAVWALMMISDFSKKE